MSYWFLDLNVIVTPLSRLTSLLASLVERMRKIFNMLGLPPPFIPSGLVPSGVVPFGGLSAPLRKKRVYFYPPITRPATATENALTNNLHLPTTLTHCWWETSLHSNNVNRAPGATCQLAGSWEWFFSVGVRVLSSPSLWSVISLTFQLSPILTNYWIFSRKFYI